MSYLRWSEDLRVGVEDVDRQHQGLVDLVNRLHTAMLTGQGKAAVGPTIDALVAYTITHFTTEQDYFEALDYPEAAAHIAQHRGFVERVEEFKRAFDEDRVLLSVEIMDFLSDWLVDHISTSDKAFGPYLNARGVV